MMVYKELENDSAARSGAIAKEEIFSDITDEHEMDPFNEPADIPNARLD